MTRSMDSGTLKTLIDDLGCGRDIDAANAEEVFDALIGESNETLLAGVFNAWHSKGISSKEISAIARIMRNRCTQITPRHKTFVDIVGTGGSRSKTFNISTAAAFVVAGAGLPVAKHGNRAATSNSGSADVLSALGIEPAIDPEITEQCLNEIGIAFLFAPSFHRLSPTLAKVRRGLGFPTIFNCVGPLCNPAFAPHQIIGTWDPSMAEKIGSALSELGTTRSWVVHGENELDEISISGKTKVCDVSTDGVNEFAIDPETFGLSKRSTDDCKVNSADESALLIRRVMENKEQNSAAEQLVLINAAAALVIAGTAKNAVDGATMATESIRSGNAFRKMRHLREATRS